MHETNKLITVALISAAIISLITSAAFMFIFSLEEEVPYEKGIDSTVSITAYSENEELSTATGFALSHNGVKILTNAHAVMQTDSEAYVDLRLRDVRGNECQAEVLHVDQKNDIAILGMKTNELDLHPLSLSSSSLEYGQKVFISSNARGYGISVQDGIISIPSLVISSDGLEKQSIQTTIPLNKGSSGAPLIDENGNVVGMMSFRMRDESGNIVQGLSYAIPSSLLTNALKNVT